jgi:hypothetical protein
MNWRANPNRPWAQQRHIGTEMGKDSQKKCIFMAGILIIPGMGLAIYCNSVQQMLTKLKLNV